MKKLFTPLLCLILSFFATNHIYAQTKNPYELAKEDGFSYRSLMKMIENDSLYIGSQFERPYNDLMSILYSRVGHYKDAMRMAEKGYLFSDKTRFDKDYENVITIPLSEVMDSIIANNRVIMLNEMHFNPHNRAFVISWLEKCYQNGYRYFAAETLFAKDSLVNDRRTVLLGETGFYSDEPVFGDLLRTALNMGYTLVPYEADGWGVDRERNEAENLIKNILDKDPEAKFLLLGGMGHITDRKGWSMMGGFFKEQSGIDPFTMDCAMFFSEQYESMDSLRTVYFDRIDAMPVHEPVIIYDTVKHIYTNLSGMDATCCLPRTRFIEDNIPDWKMYNGKVLYKIDRRFIKKYGFPEGCVSAFLKSEGEQCVPVDQYMYSAEETELKLALYKGEYLLRFDDGNSYKYKVINVK